MIIGHGDIASVLQESSLLLFASGVSNSQETRQSEFDREERLLVQQDPWRHIVYFSTLSVFYASSPYTQHKLRMEALVQAHFSRYTIVRIGNIDWGKNPHTLINYLRTHPDAKLRDEWRYIISREEFLDWIRMIPQSWSCEMNLTGTRMKVREVYERYVAPNLDRAAGPAAGVDGQLETA